MVEKSRVCRLAHRCPWRNRTFHVRVRAFAPRYASQLLGMNSGVAPLRRTVQRAAFYFAMRVNASPE